MFYEDYPVITMVLSISLVYFIVRFIFSCIDESNDYTSSDSKSGLSSSQNDDPDNGWDPDPGHGHNHDHHHDLD